MESMSSYKAQVEKYGTPISDAQFKALRSYAESRNIRLSGFKDFVGDIETIKLVIDDIAEIARDFPKILDGKEGVILELDYNLGSDFATTVSGHIIHLNGGYFADVDEMQEEYAEGVAKRRFVKGTDWRFIARQEIRLRKITLLFARRWWSMKSYSEVMYWRENKAWYVVNDEKDRFELTKKATPRAVESFKMYLRQNNLPDSPVPVNYGNGEAMI